MNASSSAKDQNERLFIPYGTGYVLGDIVTDNVLVAGVTVASQGLGQATVMGKFFENFPLDGILGLGFPQIAVDNITPVFDNMWTQKLVPQNLFSLYLDNTNGDENSVLTFGSIPSQYYTGPVSYVPLIAENYWLTKLTSLSVNGQVVKTCPDEQDCLTVIDSGTSIIVGVPAVMEPIIKAIGPIYPNCSNANDPSLPVITFNWNGVEFPLTKEFYVVRQQDPTTGQIECSSGFFSTELSAPLNIIGDVFLRAYFSVWDRSTNPPRVGFAKSVTWNQSNNN